MSFGWWGSLIVFFDLVCVIMVIFFDNKRPITTLAWVLTMSFLPIIGILLYIVFGNRIHFKRQKAFKIKQSNDDMYYKGLMSQMKFLKNDKLIFNDPDVTEYKDLIAMNLEYGNSIYCQNNDVKVFTNGADKFRSLIKDLENAEESINLLYYIYRNDQIGKKILDILIAKAKTGVKVKVIYDDIGSLTTNKNIFKPLVNAGGEVYRFLPSKLWINFRTNYRNHRKIVVIDGTIGYTGGMNIGDEYASLGKIKPWRDTHLRIVGDAVYILQMRFLMDWYYASKSTSSNDDVLYFPPHLEYNENPPGQVGMQILSSGPDQDDEQIKYAYIKMINRAKKHIYIQTPYFIPDAPLLESLKIASMSGTEVIIMLPKIYDKLFVYRASTSYMKELLPYGVQFYFYQGFLHSKVVIMDDKITSIGTANVDIRSFLLDFEVNAFIYNTKFTKEHMAIFNEDLKHCDHITEEIYRNRPITVKFMEAICRLFSPLL